MSSYLTSFVYVGGFLEEIATISKTSCAKLWLETLPERSVKLQDVNFGSSFKHGLSIFANWLAVQNGQNVGFLDIVRYQFYRAVYSVLKGCDEWKQFVNIILSIIFHETVKYFFFKDRIVRSTNAALVSLNVM